MLRSHIRVALRQLRRNKGYAFINIAGLSLGLTSFLLIGLFVQYELGYDRFHSKSDRIFHIASEMPGLFDDRQSYVAVTPSPLAEALVSEIPEVENAVHITKIESLLQVDEVSTHKDGLLTTTQFFDVFDFELIHGNPRIAFAKPNTIVVTRSTALEYFGTTDVVGKSVSVSHLGEHFSGVSEMTVVGVLDDVPDNSHIVFDYLVPVSTSSEMTEYIDNWASNSNVTYAVLKAGASESNFTAKLGTIAAKYLPMSDHFRDRPNEIGSYFPQRLEDIHLRSVVPLNIGPQGDIRYVYLFSIIGILILAIATINYVNFSTAQSASRLREIGIRKAIGARREQLVSQYMGEAVVPSTIAVVLSVVAAYFLLPGMNNILGREIDWIGVLNWQFFALLGGFGLGVGVLAGSYPALVLSSIQPVPMLKGLLRSRPGTLSFRNALVVGQFVATVVLAIGAIVVYRQISFVQMTETGLNRDQVISISSNDHGLYERFEALKDNLEQQAGVVLVSAAQSDPTDINSATRARSWEGNNDESTILIYRSSIQHNYLDLFDIPLTEGRDFSVDVATDEDEAIIINETLKTNLGWETAVGKWINYFGRESRVIGVVEDFNFTSLHNQVAPVALLLNSDSWFHFQKIFVKIRSEDVGSTLAGIERTFRDFSPGQPFEYRFLDDAFDDMYATEQRLGTLFGYFTLIALGISCLGLIGLTAFSVQERRKEIGVRKVLGASVLDVLVTLSRDYLRLVVVGFVIAVPIASYLSREWLQGFAYRTSIGWEPFVSVGLVVVVLAGIAISFSAGRAALANPVISLRSE